MMLDLTEELLILEHEKIVGHSNACEIQGFFRIAGFLNLFLLYTSEVQASMDPHPMQPPLTQPTQPPPTASLYLTATLPPPPPSPPPPRLQRASHPISHPAKPSPLIQQASTSQPPHSMQRAYILRPPPLLRQASISQPPSHRRFPLRSRRASISHPAKLHLLMQQASI